MMINGTQLISALFYVSWHSGESFKGCLRLLPLYSIGPNSCKNDNYAYKELSVVRVKLILAIVF